jgi:hypothetical protein
VPTGARPVKGRLWAHDSDNERPASPAAQSVIGKRSTVFGLIRVIAR